jgi:hypothetical protein
MCILVAFGQGSSCVTLATHVFKLQYASNLDICCVVYVDVLSKYVI